MAGDNGSIMSMFNVNPGSMSFAGMPASPTGGTTGIPGAPGAGGAGPAPNQNAGMGVPGTGAPQNTGAGGPDLNNTGENKSPLDDFKTLWETPKDDKGNPLPPTSNAVSIAFDPAKMGEALNKVNLASNVPADLVQKALGGDQQAFIEAMNAVGKNTFMLAAQSAVKLMEDALKKHDASVTARMPGLVKEHMTSDRLVSENPVFSHPSTAPVLQALQKQFQLKHPNATATELQGMAKQYLAGVAEMFNAGNNGVPGNNGGQGGASGNGTTQNAGTASDDWEAFFKAGMPGA